MIISFAIQANLELANCFIVLIRLQLLTNANFLIAVLHSIKTFAASLLIVAAFVFALLKFPEVTLGQQVNQELFKVAIIVTMAILILVIIVKIVIKIELDYLPTVYFTAHSTASVVVFAAVDYCYYFIELIVAFLSFYESFLLHIYRCKSGFLRLCNLLQTILNLKQQVHLHKDHHLVLCSVFLSLSLPLFKLFCDCKVA